MNKESKRQIRVLHVVGGMNRGGVETWLMHILRNIDRERFKFDFLVHTSKPCAYDEEIRELGSRIIPCLVPSKPWCYAMNFARIMTEYGPYDVVHSHVHHYSGFVLWLAKRAGVPILIAHSHNDTSGIDFNARILRKTYLSSMKDMIRKHATTGLGCSVKASVALFGTEWEKDRRWRILHYGVDLNAFEQEVDEVAVRGKLGIPSDAFVVGHVGRFSEQKNHIFLLDIAEYLVKQVPDVRLLLVGDGELRKNIERKVAQLGLIDHVVFSGLSSDVPRLMMGAMDAFLFPSLYEGLGLVLIEAQAAGLPCIFSDIIPKEVDAVPSLLYRVGLDQPAQRWAEIVVAAKNSVPLSKKHALDMVYRGGFNITESLEQLKRTYEAYL